MEKIQLDVQVRDQVGRRRIKSIRQQGFVPGVVYGEETKTTHIKVERRSYERIMRFHQGQSFVLHLNVMEGEKKVKDYAAIIKQEQRHPVSDDLVHLDFQQISLKKEIVVKVPIKTKGEPIGVKKDGGSLDHVLWELDVICLPTNIPEKIEIVVDHLNIGDVIQVKDIVLPEGVRTKHDPESILVSVVPPMKEQVAPVAGAETVEVEVTKEKADKEKPGEAKAEDKAEKKSEEKTK